MARPLRIDYPDTFYHVLSRGNERRPIYYEPQDYLKFLELLEKTAEKFHVEIHAYVLMENHYHLLLRTRQGNLSRAIQWLGVSYTGWFNREAIGVTSSYVIFLIDSLKAVNYYCLYGTTTAH